MRITEYEKNVIVKAVKTVDPDAEVWLFGSRADDNKKGGDIDIAIFSDRINKDIMQKIKVNRLICDKIGEQKIDIITTSDGKEAIFRLAVAEGVQLR
ncbi:MAG: nucleotidyltransferase domain-containing protein [Treponema sp.]|nr:nucleotidyltransferase domain-containing protein [Treponema sp.]